MSEYDNPYYNGMQSLRRAYGDRRGLVPEMLNRADDLMTKSIAHAEARTAGRIEQAQADADRVVEQAEAKVDHEREMRRKAEERARNLQATLDEKRTFRDKRMRDGDDVEVTILRDVSGWQVADLEEIAYRLRLGGAVDDTPIEIDKTAIRSHVPDPNVVSLARPERAKPDLPDTYAKGSRLHAGYRAMHQRPAVIAVILAVLSVLAGVGMGAVFL